MKYLHLFTFLLLEVSLGFISHSRQCSNVANVHHARHIKGAERPDAIPFYRRLISLGTTLTVALSIFFNQAPASFGDESSSLLSEVWGIVNENYVDSTFNGNDWVAIREEYLTKLKAGASEHELINKMMSKLDDKYSRLLDKSYFESLWKFDAIGIGVIFQSTPGRPMVVSANPIAGSSSEKAGFHKGDMIYAINGRDTDKMTAMDVLDMMSNDESDVVSLVYGRVDQPDDSRQPITLTRSKQTATNPVYFFPAKASDGSLAGYVRLKEFNSASVPELRTALLELNRQGVQEFILDLRGNTGGGFQFALNIGGMFMGDRPMVTALGKQTDRMVFKSSYPSGVLTDKPLVLWVDGLSASASEVLAGGLRDNCRAALVGSKTFGKGKIQAVFGLSDGEGLTLTVAQYITPRGTVIQSRGLQPDLPVDSLSPYLRLLVDPLLGQPDISKIDFSSAKKVLNQCQVTTSESVGESI